MSFAPELLAGRRLAITGVGGRRDGDDHAVISERLAALGARVDALGADVLANEDSAAGWARDRVPLHGLVCDTAPAFGEGGADALRTVMEDTWRAVRAIASGALIDSPDPGRLVLIAPRPGSGPHAAAARAALENLARTLSVEWARHAITAVALCPGEDTTDHELAELVCFLVSPAGGYFTGCRFELGAVRVA